MLFSKRTTAITGFAVTFLAAAAIAATIQYTDDSVSYANVVNGGSPAQLKSTGYGYNSNGQYVTVKTSVYAKGKAPNSSYTCQVQEYDNSVGRVTWSSGTIYVNSTETTYTYSVPPLTSTKYIRVMASSSQQNLFDNTVYDHIFEVSW